MWLSQTDKFIVPEGSVNSAPLTILVACSGFSSSPSHLMQPETVKFQELWFLRIVSTDVAVTGASGWNGNWTECGGASWIAVPLFRNTMLLGVTWRLDSVIGCWVWNLFRNNWHLDDSLLCTMTLTNWVLSFSVCSCMSKYKFLVLLLSCTSWTSCMYPVKSVKEKIFLKM